MNFSEKNKFLTKHQSGKHFDKDRELFTKYFPSSPIHADLRRVSSFTKRKLDGEMLYKLLDRVTPEEILKNREAELPKEVIIETVEQAINVIREVDPEFLPDRMVEDDRKALLEKAKGKTIAEFKEECLSFIEEDKHPDTIDSIEGVKAIFEALEVNIENIPDKVFDSLVGKTEDGIKEFVTFRRMLLESVTQTDPPVNTEQSTDESDQEQTTNDPNAEASDETDTGQSTDEPTPEATGEAAPEPQPVKKKGTSKKSSPE